MGFMVKIKCTRSRTAPIPPKTMDTIVIIDMPFIFKGVCFELVRTLELTTRSTRLVLLLFKIILLIEICSSESLRVEAGPTVKL